LGIAFAFDVDPKALPFADAATISLRYATCGTPRAR
jgi:hypothetical protein